MIWEAHYSWVVEHFEVNKTMAGLQKYFYWSSLREDVGKYIRSCIACAISKPTIKKKGLYIPPPAPSRPWENIFMDYMSSLHSIKHGNDCIFVVVKKLSKMAILVSCKKSIPKKSIAKKFFE